VNWWLMALAFALGVVVTASLVVRRVHTVATPVAVIPPEPVPQQAPEPQPEPEPEVVAPLPDPPAPHGPGSARPDAHGAGPDGWTVKGNEESKLYHSPESPSFGITRAEVWFRDAATAEAAGFNRWDSGKSQRGLKPRT
jgi:uncharacterized membrane protein ArfC